MIRVPREFKPLMDQLSSATRHRATARAFDSLLRCRHGVIRLVGDETVDGHRGKKAYGKARHRDAVRSSHSPHGLPLRCFAWHQPCS